MTSNMTLRPDAAVVYLDGKPYHVLMETQDGASSRQWVEQWVSDQDTPDDLDEPFELPLESFHEGCGFSFDEVLYTYEYAHKWDATAPGRLRTWDIDTTTVSSWAVANSDKGWLEVIGGYLYALASNVGKKFDPADWSVDDTEDFAGGDNRVISGRPGRLDGKLYVPIRDTDDDSLEVFQELTTIATAPTADTWTAGPSGKEARSFINAQQDRQGRLWRVTGDENEVASCAIAPVTEGNWSDHNSDGYVMGIPGERVTDMAIFDRLLFATMNNGLHHLSETYYYVNDLPGIGHFSDISNGVGIETWQDRSGPCMVIPHRLTDYRFAPGIAMRPIGPAQEGGLETELSPDVQGRTWGQLAIFPWLFQFKEDEQNSDGFITALHPGYGSSAERPARSTPSHCFFKTEGGRYEAGAAVHDTANDILYLAALHRNNSDGNRNIHLTKLPRGTIYPSGDKRVDHAVESATFSTVRYTFPSRNILKQWQKVELHLTVNPATNHPGFEVWASVEDGAAFQLQDGAGAAKSVLASGRHEFFFPKTASAVGRWVRLEFRVPAITGGENPVDITVRNARLHGFYDPEQARIVQTTFVIGPGQHLDNSSDRRTEADIREDLEALAQPQTAPVLIEDPWGREYYGKVRRLRIQEAIYKGGPKYPLMVANLRIREAAFS